MSVWNSENWNSKKECRSYFNSLCAERFSQGLVQNQKQLTHHLQQFLLLQKGVWAAYRALPREASVDGLIFNSQIEWLFPRVVMTENSKRLEFCRTHSFKQGAFGILEPDEQSVVVDIEAKDAVQGFLVPGLAFDDKGHRLGKGQGFYDRALQNFSGLKVGVCFDFQFSKQILPAEEHDINVDLIVTESGVFEAAD